MQQNIITTLDSGKVVRYHSAVDIPNKQTVAEHSWGVAVIVSYLAGKGLTLPLLLEAIGHDCGEIHMGDAPAPVKWAAPELGAMLKKEEEKFRTSNTSMPPQFLTIREGHILKLADMLDGFVFCNNQPENAVTKRWYDAIVEYTIANVKDIPLVTLVNTSLILTGQEWPPLDQWLITSGEPTPAYVNQD